MLLRLLLWSNMSLGLMAMRYMARTERYSLVFQPKNKAAAGGFFYFMSANRPAGGKDDTNANQSSRWSRAHW